MTVRAAGLQALNVLGIDDLRRRLNGHVPAPQPPESTVEDGEGGAEATGPLPIAAFAMRGGPSSAAMHALPPVPNRPAQSPRRNTRAAAAAAAEQEDNTPMPDGASPDDAVHNRFDDEPDDTPLRSPPNHDPPSEHARPTPAQRPARKRSRDQLAHLSVQEREWVESQPDRKAALNALRQRRYRAKQT